MCSTRDDCPTALERVNGVLMGYCFNAYSRAFQAVSGAIDYNQRGNKSVQNVEVAYRDATGMQAGIQLRYETGGDWLDLPWIPLNRDSSAYPMGTATEFRIKIKGVMGANGRCQYAYHRWKLTGQRNIRGIYGQAKE